MHGPISHQTWRWVLFGLKIKSWSDCFRSAAWSHTLSCSGDGMRVIVLNLHIAKSNEILTTKWVLWLYSEDVITSSTFYRRCKNTKKPLGGGMLSYFVWRSLPVNHLNSVMSVFLRFFLGLIVVLKGQTTLPWWSYIVALIMGAFITVSHNKNNKNNLLTLMQYLQPFSTVLVARLGSGVGTIQLMKMIAGVINPGRPVANLYVSRTCHLMKILFLPEFRSRKK